MGKQEACDEGWSHPISESNAELAIRDILSFLVDSVVEEGLSLAHQASPKIHIRKVY